MDGWSRGGWGGVKSDRQDEVWGGMVGFLPDFLSRHILVGYIEGMGGMDGWSKDRMG